MPKNIFEEFVLAGTYLALLILFGIGYLFKTIINFANPTRLQQILSEELFIEAKSNLVIHLLTKLSSEAYLQTMQDHNIRQQKVTLPSENEEKLIFDINLSKLTKELSKDKTGTQKYYTTLIALNVVTTEYDSFITPNPIDTKGNQTNLAKCLITSKKNKLITQSEEYRSYFDAKLQDFSSAGKHDKVNEILAIYQGLFSLQMKHG